MTVSACGLSALIANNFWPASARYRGQSLASAKPNTTVVLQCRRSFTTHTPPSLTVSSKRPRDSVAEFKHQRGFFYSWASTQRGLKASKRLMKPARLLAFNLIITVHVSNIVWLIGLCRSFIQLIGDLSELRAKTYDDESRGFSSSGSSSVSSRPGDTATLTPAVSEYAQIRLGDLDVVATLGIGGFGRVELVQCSYDRSLTFALKCLKKQHIVNTLQQEHIYSEKNIMMSCRSPFIARWVLFP